MGYYILLPALFNVGWASVQISTMSVVVSISQSQTRRDRLVSLRNGFTYISSLVVLVLAGVLFKTIEDPTNQFRVLVYIITFLGFCLSLFYILFVGIQENRLTNDAQYYDQLYRRRNQSVVDRKDENENENRKTVSENVKDWKGWLKEGAFYVHGGVYMFARLAMNLTMTAIPFYLKYVLKFAGAESEDASDTPIEIALVPLCSYV